VRFEWYRLERGSGSIGGGGWQWKVAGGSDSLWSFYDDSDVDSGSGRVAVVSFDRGGRCGSNGTG
jgi:hypothetical protein